MGKVGAKESSSGYDDYSKGDSKKPEKELKLNDRITKLTESIAKPIVDGQDLSNIKTNFNKELRKINASHGDVETQESLLKLSDKIREKFNDKESDELAFQIQCTAQGMTDFELDKLPLELQKHIFYEAGANAIHDKSSGAFSVSKMTSEAAILAKNEWINANHIDLKKLGCKTAHDAVKYVIDHKLTSANLTWFPDLSDNDLIELSNHCPNLEKLSIRSDEVGEGAVEALGKLTNLKHLDVSNCMRLPGDKFLEMLEGKTALQSLNVWNCDIYPEEKFVEVLKKMTQLQNLNVGRCHLLPGDKFVEMLEGKTALQSLNVWGCRQLPGAELAEVLKKLTNLQTLSVGDCNQIPEDEFIEALKKLPKLQHLDVSLCHQLSRDKFVEVIGTMTELESLYISDCENLHTADFKEYPHLNGRQLE